MNQPEMKFFLVSLVLFIFDGTIASNNSTSTASRPRSLADIENPKTDPTSCGRPLQSFVCDSDQILSADQGTLLFLFLKYRVFNLFNILFVLFLSYLLSKS